MEKIAQADIINRLNYFSNLREPYLKSEEYGAIYYALEHGLIPSSRSYYIPALNLALLIMNNTGVTIGVKPDVEYHPILIPTDYVFESYIRNICKEHFSQTNTRVLNGKTFPVKFFDEAIESISLQPDLLFIRGARTVSVLDVKYKVAPTAQDYYQLWCYIEGYSVNQGAFVRVTDKDETDLSKVTRDGKTLYTFAFNLADMKSSERDLIKFVSEYLIKT